MTDCLSEKILHQLILCGPGNFLWGQVISVGNLLITISTFQLYCANVGFKSEQSYLEVVLCKCFQSLHHLSERVGKIFSTFSPLLTLKRKIEAGTSFQRGAISSKAFQIAFKILFVSPDYYFVCFLLILQILNLLPLNEGKQSHVCQ